MRQSTGQRRLRYEPLEGRWLLTVANPFYLADLDGTNGFRLDGIDVEDFSGFSVHGAGDVNGDGFDDVIVGASDATALGNGGAGQTYVVFGKAGGFSAAMSLADLNGSNGFRLEGIAVDDGSGFCVSAAGDVNGDGYDDLIVGAPDADPGGLIQAGECYVVFGMASGFPTSVSLASLNGLNGFRVVGAAPGDRVGRAVSGAGDINADGFDDVILGAPRAASGSNLDAGRAYVVFGRASGFPSMFSVAAIDGTNGFRMDGVEARDQLGYAVSGAGDVNADGIDDLLVGAPSFTVLDAMFTGKTYVVFGTTGGFGGTVNLAGLNGTNGFRVDGVAAGEEFGFSVSGAGDVNGDGVADVIVGARLADPGGLVDAGEGYVVFGKATGFAASLSAASLNGSNGFRLAGANADDRVGRSVSGAGDMNGDGYSDVILGAVTADPQGFTDAGASYVVFGKAGGFAHLSLSAINGNNGFRLDGVSPGDFTGISVSGAGDINGDGRADVIVGADGANFNIGASYVVFGVESGGGPADIRGLSVTFNGAAGLTLNYEITGSVPAFQVGFYRSTDAAFGSSDVLTGSLSISASADLSVGTHTKTFTLGSGPGQVSLPGAGVTDNDFDYYLLAVADPQNLVDESGTTGGEANNTAVLAGVYHVATGPVMVHGAATADVVRVLPGSVRVEVNGTAWTYAGTDASGVRARAHAGNDRFEFTWGAGMGAAAGTTLAFLFIGGPGTNTAQLRGATSSTAGDTVSLTPTWATMAATGYSLLATNLQGITVDGQGGPDKAMFYDSTAADTFHAYPTYATLSNGQFTNRADNFPSIYAYATATGTATDTARFYAGVGNGLDLFSGSPAYAVLTGPNGTGTYYRRAEKFEVVTGDSADSESDVATLFDSASTTSTTQYTFVLDAAARFGEIQAAPTSIRANHFATTVLATRDLGADQARLSGSSDADTVQAKMDAREVWLLGSGFKYRASQVQSVEALSASGQQDTVIFYDSAGNDTFTGGPGAGWMTTPAGFSVRAADFRYVTAYSTLAGTDAAVLTGKAGTKDYLVATPTQAGLGDSSSGRGATYYDWLQGFESVTVHGQAADLDQARMSGSSGADTFLSDFALSGSPAQRDPSRPYATLAGAGFSNTAAGFRYVTAMGEAGDVAHMYAASATDLFSATPLSAVMSGTNFYYEAKGFPEVHGHGASGAKARLFDAALHVLLEVQAAQAKLSNLDSSSGPFAIWAEEFGEVTATASAGNAFAKKTVLDHVFTLILFGPWA